MHYQKYIDFIGCARLARSTGMKVSEYVDLPLKGITKVLGVAVAGGVAATPQLTNWLLYVLVAMKGIAPVLGLLPPCVCGFPIGYPL